MGRALIVAVELLGERAILLGHVDRRTDAVHHQKIIEAASELDLGLTVASG